MKKEPRWAHISCDGRFENTVVPGNDYGTSDCLCLGAAFSWSKRQAARRSAHAATHLGLDLEAQGIVYARAPSGFWYCTADVPQDIAKH
jgi:hypothetical protein